MSQKNGKCGIKSDHRMFNIIELVQERDRIGVTSIADELGIAKSTAHAHLSALEERGYVVNEGGAYRIGLQFLRHGIYARNYNRLYPRAKNKITHLAQETDERAWCQVEENGMCYYLCGAEGKHPVNPPVRVGECVHLHTIAAGKVILAHLPQERVESIIDRHGLPAKTKYTITEREELFASLADIRDRGYAFNEEESLRGLNAVGAPIQGSNGEILGALSISGPANRLQGEKFQDDLPELLLGATNELEINIAHS
jgi:DNA-binding IclR family transcriptional regulator